MDLLLFRGTCLGLVLSLLAWPLTQAPTRAIALGGALGLVIAAVLASRGIASVTVDEGAVIFTRRGGVERVPHTQIRHVRAEPADARGVRGGTEAVSITLTREGAEPLRFDVPRAQAGALIEALSGPMLRRWSTSLAQGEHVEFHDPREFPRAVVGRGLVVSLGALFLLASSVLGNRFDLFLLVGLLSVSVGSAVRTVRAVRAWRRADPGGGLAVSSAGVLPLAQVPRRRMAASAYRASHASGPWIPWAAIRTVQREGDGVAIETDTAPARIELSASTESVAPLGVMLQHMKVEADRQSFFRAGGVRVDVSDGEVPVTHEAEAIEPAARQRVR